MSPQPLLVGRSVTLHAPMQVWSAPDGQIDALTDGRTVEGIYLGDQRVASRVLITIDDLQVEPMVTSQSGGGQTSYEYLVRSATDDTPDPALMLRRERVVTDGEVEERYLLSTSSNHPHRVTLRVLIQPDATEIQSIKQGHNSAQCPVADVSENLVQWHSREVSATVLVRGAEVELTDQGCRLSWSVEVPPRGVAELSWALSALNPAGLLQSADAQGWTVGWTEADGHLTTTQSQSHPKGGSELAVPVVANADPRLPRLLATAVADLNGLRLTERGHPADVFYAAGSPWFLTLFGRDSLITARFVLADNLEMARGTLQVLARRQGTKIDIDLAEAPGKIMHELRGTTVDWGSDEHQTLRLPPVYYGTIDATVLWIILFEDAVRAGLDQATIADLMPHLRRALDWLRDHADADGDGFIEYQDLSGHGLANQGWKDSGDSIRFADGSLAKAPVALCEVQGYAYAAALAGARLLAQFEDDQQAAGFWRQWAAELAVRFRAKFWTSDELGAYPVLALDADKAQVTGVASNMGHLLGTGILNEAEKKTIVDRLMHPTMFSGYGIRTLSSDNGGYWPLSYHVGSVWTHDTAFIIDGMLREGFTAEAATLAQGLLLAAEGFDYRLPELFGGQPADQQYPPSPYPASCLPQAWAAASALVVARALSAR